MKSTSPRGCLLSSPHILALPLDRLARDLMVQETIIGDMRRQGFELVSVTEPDLCNDDPKRKLTGKSWVQSLSMTAPCLRRGCALGGSANVPKRAAVRAASLTAHDRASKPSLSACLPFTALE